MPKFEVPKKKGKKPEVEAGSLPWNSLERIIGLINPVRDYAKLAIKRKSNMTAVSENKRWNLYVPKMAFSYCIEVNQSSVPPF